MVKSAEQYKEAAEDEIKILKHVNECSVLDDQPMITHAIQKARFTDPDDINCYRVVTLLDNFTIQGINGLRK